MAMAALGAPAAMAGEQGAPPTPDNTPSIYRLFNDGEDFTRPGQRLDQQERYENLPSVKKFDPESRSGAPTDAIILCAIKMLINSR
jgi:hypothetical protein